jgi:uncharacterized protein YcbK (DUF882 family)
MNGDIDRFMHYTVYALLIKSNGRREGTKWDTEAFYLLKYISQVLQTESVVGVVGGYRKLHKESFINYTLFVV